MEPGLQELEARIHKEHWWFEGRRRILRRILAGLDLGPETKAVEVGCGTGANGEVLAPYRNTVGVDLSRFALAKCGPGHRNRVQADLTFLPMKNASVDLVLAADVLEHMEDDSVALREIHRVLKPGGFLVALVPALVALWGAQDELSHHLRRYDRSGFRSLVESAGFEIRKLTFFNIYFFLPILAVRKFMRWTRRPLRSENEYTSPLLNRILAPLFATEGYLMDRFDLPIGVSLLSVARKKTS